VLVSYEPYYMIKNGVFIFFYVDDIIVMYKKSREDQALKAI
jgi:hypothetical protein